MRCWIDLETGGLDPKKNATLQLAAIIEDNNGKIVDTFQTYIQPHNHLIIDSEALEVNGISMQTIAEAPKESDVLEQFTKLLNKHQDGSKQYEFVGYNSRFDMDFLSAMFKRSKRFQYWTYFNYYDVDVFALVKILGITGSRYDEKKEKYVPCKKLECICELFDIEFEAHDAISDIKATRKLFKKLKKRYLK